MQSAVWTLEHRPDPHRAGRGQILGVNRDELRAPGAFEHIDHAHLAAAQLALVEPLDSITECGY